MARSSTRRAHARLPSLVAEMQATLQPGLYISLLHAAAVSGQMPILTPDGRPTGEFSTLDTQQRMETAKYLLNKLVPDAPRLEMHADVNPDTIDVTEFSALPTEQLLRIIHANESAAVPAAAS